MKTLLIALAAASVLAAPALAQTPPPATAPAAKADMSKMSAEEKRKHCSDMMAKKEGMDPKMKEKHDKCMAKMKAEPKKDAPAEHH
jgi:hypothetical protein